MNVKSIDNNNKNIIQNPENITFSCNIIEGSFVKYSFDNTFCVFKSINDIFYIIYSIEDKSIISYNLINKKKINDIKNAHNTYISSFRHYLDNNSKRDLVMSISAEDNNIKIWNVCDFYCLLNLKNINKTGFLISACFLYDKNQNYIITSNRNWEENIEPIKVFDFNGNKIKEIADSKEDTIFIDIYYDKKSFTNYIITGHYSYSQSFKFNENKMYHKYYAKRPTSNYRCLITKDNEEIIKLIGINDDSFLIIWNFHTGDLLSKIIVDDDYLCGLCLFKEDYIFVGVYNRTIKLIDLKKGIVIKNFDGHEHSVICLKKIIHPKYGESLISQGLSKDQIKLWTYKI